MNAMSNVHHASRSIRVLPGAARRLSSAGSLVALATLALCLTGCAKAPVSLAQPTPMPAMKLAATRAVAMPIHVETQLDTRPLNNTPPTFLGRARPFYQKYFLDVQRPAAAVFEQAMHRVFEAPGGDKSQVPRLRIMASLLEFRVLPSNRSDGARDARFYIEWETRLEDERGVRLDAYKFKTEEVSPFDEATVPDSFYRSLERAANEVTTYYARSAAVNAHVRTYAATRRRERTLDELGEELEKARQLVLTAQREEATGAATAAPLPFPPDTRRIWALLVGVGAYRNFPDKALQYAAADAETVRTTLVARGVPDAQIVTLTDAQATRMNVVNRFTEHLGQAGPGDTVLIYFSGHGAAAPDPSPTPLYQDGLEKYLLTHDADLNRLEGSSISMSDLRYLMNYRLRSHRIILLVDSCYAGSAMDAVAGGGKSLPTPQLAATKSLVPADDYAGTVRRVVTAPPVGQPQVAGAETYQAATVVIASSQARQLSREDPGLGASVFTHYVVDAISGAGDVSGDGRVDVIELFAYVSDEVARHTGQQQTPIMVPGAPPFALYVVQ